MTEQPEAALVAERVNRSAWGPTEPDEDQVLAELGYTFNLATGVYEGDGIPL